MASEIVIALLLRNRLNTDLFALSIVGFDGAFNLPLQVEQRVGLFEKHDLEVSFDYVKGLVDLIIG
jgi:hypothetical protein